MALEANDRVLIKPLGVKGTVVRLSVFGQFEVEHGRPGRYLVQDSISHAQLVWKENELEKLGPGEVSPGATRCPGC